MRRSGATLLELLVVVTVLGVLAGVTAFALGRRSEPDGRPADPDDRARRAAILSGSVVVAWVAGRPRRFLPDGRQALGGSLDQ